MNNLNTLIKFNLKYYLVPRLETKKEKRNFIIVLVVLGLVFIIPLIQLLSSIYLMASSLASKGVINAMLSALFGISQIAALLMSISTFMQVMFFAKDNEILANLPVKTSEIFISKIITITVLEMFISLIFVLPSTVVTAIALHNVGISLPAIYYILIPIATITLPMIPTLLISLFSFPVMKIMTYFKKHQTLGAIIAIILIVGIVMAIYIPIYSNMYSSTPDVPIDEMENQGTNDDIFESLFSDDMVNLIVKIGKIFFHTYALASLMLGIKVGINALIYFGFSISLFVIGLLLALFLYNSTVSSMLESGGGKENVKEGSYEKLSLMKTLLLKEIKVISRDTQKLINTMMGVVFAPVFAFIMMFIMSKNLEPDMSMFLLGMSLMMSIIMLSTNVSTSVGFSLDGPNFALYKTFPIQYKSIFNMKLLLNSILGFIGVLLSSIISCIYAKANILDFIGYNISCDIVVYSIYSIALYRDLKKPNLNWTNIKEITKNNFATIIPLAITLPFALLGMFIVGFIPMLINNKYLGSLLAWAIMIVVSVIYYFACAYNIYSKIENTFEEVEA